MGYYYGHPQNVFWKTLATSLGLAEPPGDVEARQRFVRENGIALWDVFKSVEIDGAADASIHNAEPNRFRDIIAKSNINAIFTTGRTGTEAFNSLCSHEAGMRAVYLPSTSPANRRTQATQDYAHRWSLVGKLLRHELVSSAGMKELDQRTIEEMGVPSLVLMERAALAVVDALMVGVLAGRQDVALVDRLDAALVDGLDATLGGSDATPGGPDTTMDITPDATLSGLDATPDTTPDTTPIDKPEAAFADKTDTEQTALCICGAGNNGGDGFAVARLLHLAGISSKILFIGDKKKMSTETKQQALIAENYGVPCIENKLSEITESRVLVDALFGIGLTRDLSDIYLNTVKAICKARKAGAYVLAVDVPSGISADTGEVLGTAVSADKTVTFAYNKIGLTIGKGREHAGDVHVADIGIYPI